MNDEWNQERASNRGIETMRQIAQDALAFDDDPDYAVYESYARQHNLTVNEIVYYLNAYDYGGDDGLHAIRNPDIIPPDVVRNAKKLIAKMLDAHFEGRLRYRITDDGTGIGLHEIQRRMDGSEYLFEICQFRRTNEANQWHLYWMRKFEAWWPYSLPEQGRRYTVRARVQQVLDDGWSCFWG
ncbi:DUF3024 domain-containing protein [Chloroflexota bacterium]